MSPEVISRKLVVMTEYLKEFLPYENSSFEDFMADHYKVERLIELLVMSATDISFHVLEIKGEPPPISYRAGLLRLGELGLIPDDLSQRLALGSGMRNILVHEYETIDHKLLHASVPQIIKDMREFMDCVSRLV